MDALTAAHRTLPLPVIARVTNLENGRSLHCASTIGVVCGAASSTFRATPLSCSRLRQGHGARSRSVRGQAEVAAQRRAGASIGFFAASDVHAAPIDTVGAAGTRAAAWRRSSAAAHTRPPPSAWLDCARRRRRAPISFRRRRDDRARSGAHAALGASGRVSGAPECRSSRRAPDPLRGARFEHQPERQGVVPRSLRPLANVDDADAMLNKSSVKAKNGAPVVVD